jgi:hypothetical protein
MVIQRPPGKERAQTVAKIVRTPAQWAKCIGAAYHETADAFLKLGRTLLAAKRTLPHGEFLKMIESDLPFTATTAQRLMKISGRLTFGNIAFYDVMGWVRLA